MEFNTNRERLYQVKYHSTVSKCLVKINLLTDLDEGLVLSFSITGTFMVSIFIKHLIYVLLRNLIWMLSLVCNSKLDLQS